MYYPQRENHIFGHQIFLLEFNTGRVWVYCHGAQIDIKRLYQNKFKKITQNKKVLAEVHEGMYELPHAGRVSHEELVEDSVLYEYKQLTFTLSL